MSIWHSSGHIQGKLSIRRFPSLLWQPQDIYLNFSMAHTIASFRYLFKGLVSIINRKLILKSNRREKQPFVTFAPWWTLLSFKAQSNCHLSGFYLLHHSPSTLVTLPGLLCNYCNCSIKLMNIYWVSAACHTHCQLWGKPWWTEWRKSPLSCSWYSSWRKKKRIWGKKSNSSVSEKTPCPLPLCILRNSLVLTEGKLSRC